MKIASVVGARPQFIKLAPIVQAAASHGLEHILIHTGQHYDPMLSEIFFTELGIPSPDHSLDVGSGSHAHQTSAILAAIEGVLHELNPNWVLVYGDTNSTLAATLAAVKIHLPVAHLEAGLRSFNRRMPEEHNRVLVDHAADLLLAPTDEAMRHLASEGLAHRAVLVGDIMTDALMNVMARVRDSFPAMLDEEGLESGGFFLATIHRAESTDDPDRLRAIRDALARLDQPTILLVHPRLRARAQAFGLDLDMGMLRARPPLGYPDLVSAIMHAKGIVTDSGGLQKEAFLLRTPCTTVRTETEWPETVRLGWNVLVDPGEELVAATRRRRPIDTGESPYGDGRAAERVLNALVDDPPLAGYRGNAR